MKTMSLRQGSSVLLGALLALSVSFFNSCTNHETTEIKEETAPTLIPVCDPALPEPAPGYPDPYAKLAKGDWTFKGPYDWGSRVVTIEMDPQNPYRLYAGSASGGLWVNSDTRTQGWEWVNTNPHKVMGVKAIAIHPSNSDIMYIGTGEVYHYNESLGGYDVHKNRGSYGVGVLMSEDKGETWSTVEGLPDNKRLGVIDVAISEEDSGYRVWAATSEGLYLSDDGKTFSQVLDKKMVTSISINPLDRNDLVVAVGNLNIPADEAGIYRTTDAGQNWTRVYDRPASEYMGKTELARAPGNPAKLYALTGTWAPLSFYNNVTIKGKVKPGDCYWPDGLTSHTNNQLFTSTNSGADWTVTQDSFSLSGSQGHYSMNLAVNPAQEEELLLGGIFPLRRSPDGGKTINGLKTTGVSALNNGCLTAAMGNFDVHQILYGPENNGLIYICSDQGVYMSENNLKSAHRINKNLAIMQFYPRMAFAPDSLNLLFGCAQDYGPGALSYMGMDDKTGRDQWELLYGYGHEAGSCLYDAKNDIGYLTIHLGNMIARRHMDPNKPVIDPPDTTAANGAIYYIPDNSPSETSHLCDAHASWNTPLAFSPSKPEVIYAGKDILYRSETQKGDVAAGKVWTAPDPQGKGLDGNPIHQLIVAEDNHLELFAATSPRNGAMHIFHSLDGGKTWDNITGTNLPETRNPSYLTLDPTDKNTLYLTLEDFGAGHVWKGQNQGGNWTWTAIDEGLPDAFTRSVTVDPSNPGHLYVATDYGVYKSTDAGTSWSQFSSGLPAAIEGIQLILYDKQRLLRLVSHGNGLWERSI